MTTVVICAHNEEERLAPVLAAVWLARDLGSVASIVVVVDRSSDRTADIAARYADLVVPVTKGTKGTAMTVGAAQAVDSTVLFLDADIRGLTPSQVSYLATAPPARGMLVGVRGTLNGARLPGLLAAWPSISGERRLPRDFVRSLHLAGKGWWSETIINAEVVQAGMPHRQVILDGVANDRPKGLGASMSETLRVGYATLLYAPELARYTWTLER